MSAGSTQGIGPVSVRYAAQIRELLYTQAVQKAAAEQEAVRQQEAAEKAARLQPAVDQTPAVKVEAVAKADDTTSSVNQVPADEPAPKQTPGEIVDIQA